MKCIECGKETENFLCPECKAKLRENYSEWEDYLKYIEKQITKLNSPKQDYIKACILIGNRAGIVKSDRGWLYSSFLDKDLAIYTLEERLRIKGWLLDAMWQDYEYDRAEEIASTLILENDIPYSTVLSLADYFTRTRRYDAAAAVLKPAYQTYAFDEEKSPFIVSRIDDNSKRYESSFEGKGEYLPNPKDNRDVIRKKYVDFLSSIGIEVELKKPRPKPIPKEDYPHLKVLKKPEFDSFVAFDFETTGLSPAKDTIIEVGAIKVINNKVSEAKKYAFVEFVKPFGSKVTPKITKITGIKATDVVDARQAWEVIPDFLEFAEGLPLVGFNNKRFDNLFLERAGRYSNIIIKNKTFDVMDYANALKSKFPAGQKFNLGDLSKVLSIKNPEAHRAYADAITTAKVLIKLKKLNNSIK